MTNKTTFAFFLWLGATFLSPSARAGSLVYNPDDLLLGFRATGGTGVTQDYLVDIGPAAVYTGANASFSVEGLGNIGADLTNVFGSDWSSRSDLFWSVSGTAGLSGIGNDPAKTLYATTAEEPFGTPAMLWNRGSNSAQGVVSSKMVSLAQAFAFTAGSPNASTANSSVALIQNAEDTNSYASFYAGTASFGYFDPTIEGTFANGTARGVLDLVRLLPGSPGTPGEIVGTFTLDDRANLIFNVPEPSTTAALTLGIAMLAMVRGLWSVPMAVRRRDPVQHE